MMSNTPDAKVLHRILQRKTDRKTRCGKQSDHCRRVDAELVERHDDHDQQQ